MVGIEVSEEAVEVLKRSIELGGVDPATGGVRLRAARDLGGGMKVQVELAGAPGEDESVVETRGIRLFIANELTQAMPNATVEVEPTHDLIVVRPRSTP